MAKAHVSCSIVLATILLWPALVEGGEVFTGFQSDDEGQYYSFLGVRTPLTSEESKLQPFLQVMGAGLGYTFKDKGTERDVNVQFVTPSLGVSQTGH